MAILRRITGQSAKTKKSGETEVLDLSEVREGLPSHPLARSDESQGPYSHGLESIYALQEVDPSKVKTLGTQSDLPPPPPGEEQMCMSFARGGTGTLPSLRFAEPIQSLPLPGAALPALLDAGKRTVGDLYALIRSGGLEDLLDPKYAAAVGHQVVRYLSIYDDPYRLETVEFSSLLRLLLADLDRVSVYLYLKPYDLEQILPLTPAQQAMLRHLSASQRQERRENVARAMVEMGRQERLWHHFRLVIREFIAPWMSRRLQLACRRSLRDRVRAVASDRSSIKRIFKLLTDLYSPGKDLWTLLLREVGEGVYTLDEETAVQYDLVVARAKTYFYHPSIQYPLPQLVSLLSREIAMRWKGFREGFIERVIKYDPSFRCRKALTGTRMVRLTR